MFRHQIAMWSFRGRLYASSQNPPQDCCGSLKCGILFKMAVSSSSVLSAHFLHTHSPLRNQTGQQRELFVGSRKPVTPSAANILHSIAAEGRYMTWRNGWHSTLPRSCCGHLGSNWTPFLVHLRYNHTKHFNSWKDNSRWHWRSSGRRVIAVTTSSGRRVIAVTTSPYPERKIKNLYYA